MAHQSLASLALRIASRWPRADSQPIRMLAASSGSVLATAAAHLSSAAPTALCCADVHSLTTSTQQQSIALTGRSFASTSSSSSSSDASDAGERTLLRGRGSDGSGSSSGVGPSGRKLEPSADEIRAAYSHCAQLVRLT